MQPYQLEVGLTFVLIPLTLLPVYIRILYIFMKTPKYRSLECYRIMIQTGIIHCITTPLPFAMTGIAQILDYDPGLVASHAMRLFPAGLRMEYWLGFVLALNRVKTICGLNYPDWICRALLAMTWLLGICTFVTVQFLCCRYGIQPGVFIASYDWHSDALMTLFAYSLYVAVCLTLAVYVYIIAFLIRMKLRVGKLQLTGEKSIFVYALTRFCIDFPLILVYYSGIEHTPLYDFANSMACILSTMFVPPALYLILNQSIRSKFIPLRRMKVFAVRSTTGRV